MNSEDQDPTDGYYANLLVWVTLPIVAAPVVSYQIAQHFLTTAPAGFAISAMVVTMAVVVVAQIVNGPAEVSAA